MVADTQTINAHLTVVAPTRPNWAGTMNRNMELLDAIIGSYFVINALRGVWQNSTVYAANDTIVDSVTSTVWMSLVAHTSATIPTTFAQERANNPTYWSVYSTPARARGVWTPNTAYALNDFVQSSTQYAICIQTHTSGSSFAVDLAASKWSVLIDLSGAGATIMPVPGGAADANKFAVINAAGNGYSIVNASNARVLLEATSIGDGLFLAGSQAAARALIGAAASGAYGTAANFDVGTGPLDVVQLDSSSRLPAVDASQLTNLPVLTVNAAQFGAVGDGVTDDTAAIQAGIDFIRAVSVSSGGYLLLNDGNFKITNTLNAHNRVTLIGKGAGRVIQPTIAAATTISWYGGANSMIKFGYGVSTLAGSGIKDIRLDGRALATRCLDFKDIQHCRGDGIVLTGSTQNAFYITNTDGFDPTGWFSFENVQIALRGGSTNSSNGVFIDGVGTGTSGITVSRMASFRIEHANGAGVKIGERGDSFHWDSIQTFRADVETGIGVWAAASGADHAYGGHKFTKPVVSAGFRIDKANGAGGWAIDILDDANINSGVAELVYGEGQSDVAVLSSISGRLYGSSRLVSHRDTHHHDAMFLTRFDSANNTVHTSHGSWIQGGTLGTVADAAYPGGAIDITTGAVSGNAIWITDSPAIGTTGVASTYFPFLTFTFAPLSAANIIVRIGYAADTTNPMNDFIGLDGDPATNANYRFVCRLGGVETAVVLPVAVGVANLQIRLEIEAGRAVMFYRTSGNNLWGLAGVISTNVTTAILAQIAYVRTTTAATKALRILDWKTAFRSEL